MKIYPITPPTLCQSNFRKRLSIFGRWNIRNWKLLPSTLSMQHRKFQKIVSEYFQFSNGFLIFQKFSRSVENGWIEKLVSDSDLKILRNCKIKVCGDFTTKRFCIAKRYTKSLLATPLRLLFFCSQHFVYLKSKLKKNFWVSHKIFKFIILSICRKTIFEKISKHGQKKISP